MDDGFTSFDASLLRQSQRERLSDRRFVFVEEWGMAVPIKKLTAGNLAEATSMAKIYDPDTGKIEVNEARKNIYLILFSVPGMELRDKETLENEPAGIIHRLLEEILKFSGFDGDWDVADSFSGEKKN